MKTYRNKRITDYEILCTNKNVKLQINVKITKMLRIHLNDCVKLCQNYDKEFPFCWDKYLKELVKKEMLMHNIKFDENAYYKRLEKFFFDKNILVYNKIHQFRINNFKNKNKSEELF